MERGQSVPMDAAQDVWDWEVLPDHRSFAMGHGGMRLDAGKKSSALGVHDPDHDQQNNIHLTPVIGSSVAYIADQETKEPILPPPRDAAVVVDPVAESECKDIGVVPDETTKPVVAPSVADPMVPDGHGEEEKVFLQSTDAKDADDDGKFDGEEEDVKKDSRARPECVVFSVGKLKVNGIGALCSFGVAAATVCVFLIGGRLQHHHRQQQQKIQPQFYGDDKRIQQVVQQSSRLNQAMSSVMGAGASTRANISFGGFYGGF